MLPLRKLLRDPNDRLVRFLLWFGRLSFLGLFHRAVVLEIYPEGVSRVHQIVASFDRHFVYLTCYWPAGMEDAFCLSNA